jgi:hypothetical protein
VEDVLVRSLSEWSSRRRRGMVAVVGDWGGGRHRLMARLPDRLAGDLPVQRLTLDRRLSNGTEALHWLAAQTGLPDDVDCEDVEAFAAVLSAQASRVMLVDDLHLLFLRSVGGFSGLRRVLGVMHATSEEHFWICGIHEPSWAYLSCIPAAVNLAVFRQSLHMPRPTARELGDAIGARCDAVGLSLQFDLLAGRSAPGTDPGRVLQRARDAYWRLLNDASLGLGRVAWKAFVGGLRAPALDPLSAATLAARVVMFDTPTPGSLDGATDRDLFVLTALIVHDSLVIEELAAVLNLSEGICRAACRALEARSILHGDHQGERYRVTPLWLPAVERLLRQKHFLHVASEAGMA